MQGGGANQVWTNHLKLRMVDELNHLFALVCVPRAGEERANALRAAAGRFDRWNEFARLAVSHRLAPLIYWHFREHGIACPRHVMRILAGAYLKQKMQAAAQSSTLAEITSAFRKAGIRSVTLKGGLLSHLLYPEPGLRPMDDLDILVPAECAEQARQLLCALGFTAPAAETRYQRLLHQLPSAQRMRENQIVCVEIHTSAFNLVVGDALDFSSLETPFTHIEIDGETIHGMSPTQLLWMQYHGLQKLGEPLKYIHLVDLIGLAEYFADQIDWPLLKQRYGQLWYALSALNAFTPISEKARGKIALQTDRREVVPDIGKDYTGWPRRSFSDLHAWKDLLVLCMATVSPPQWWARFFYGLPARRSSRAAIIYRHAVCFIRQGSLRLYLGPATKGGFFNPRGKPEA